MFDRSSSSTPPIDEDALRLLHRAGSLLLEYNLRTGLLRRRMHELAEFLGIPLFVDTGYCSISLHTPRGSLHHHAHELRINVGLNAAVMRVVDDVIAGHIDINTALAQLETIEKTTPRHNRWLLAGIFGAAAAALAILLSADLGATLTVALSSALGLLARQELAKRHVMLFALPFTAALIGSVLGGIVINAGWTSTPGMCLIVPALMLVPGPHLINTLYDAIENDMHTALPRLGLATGILLGAASGVFLGGWVTLGWTTVPAGSSGVAIQLPTDMLLAGIAACGFGAFYNAPWRVLWTSIIAGMVGHGIRYMCLKHGMPLETSTLLACFIIGVIASVMVKRLRVQFAAVAFASAVPMMPGVLMYQGIGGAMQIALSHGDATAQLVDFTSYNIVKAVFVVGAMAIGLVLGERITRLLRGPAH
ncbi:MAG: threonine/serine exporter family protein [Rhodocyclaceae bacterium]